MVSHRPGCTVPQCAHTTDACHHQLRRVGNSPNCQDASVRPAPSLAWGRRSRRQCSALWGGQPGEPSAGAGFEAAEQVGVQVMLPAVL
jgi:hypothetical protein